MTEIKCLQNDDWGKMNGKRRPKSNDCGAITVKVTAKWWPKPNDCKAGTYRGLYTAHCSRTMGLLSFEPSDWFPKVNQVDCLRNRKYLRTRLGLSSEGVGIMVMRDDVMRQEGETLESLLQWRRKGTYICNRLSQLTHVGEEVSPVQGARARKNACAVKKRE